MWIIFVIPVSCLSCFVSFHCSLVVTCWERADLLALLSVMCDVLLCFIYFTMWYHGSGVVLVVSIPDLCILSYFKTQFVVFHKSGRLTQVLRYSLNLA